MKKLTLMIAFLLLLSGCAMPVSTGAALAVAQEASRHDQAMMTQNQHLQEQVNSLTDDLQASIDENTELQARLIRMNNERLLYENASRDNSTVNSLVRWDAFGDDIKKAVFIGALLIAVSFSGNVALVGVLLRNTKASKVAPTNDADPFEWGK